MIDPSLLNSGITSAKLGDQIVLITHCSPAEKWNGSQLRLEFNDGTFQDGFDASGISELLQSFHSIHQARLSVFGKDEEPKALWEKEWTAQQKKEREFRKQSLISRQESLKKAHELSLQRAKENKEQNKPKKEKDPLLAALGIGEGLLNMKRKEQ